MEPLNRSSRYTSFPESPETASSASGPTAVSKPLPERAHLVERFVAHVSGTARQPVEERQCPAEPALTAGVLAFTARAPKQAAAPTFLRSDGKPFPVSEDGTPMYRQNDRAVGGNWGATKLGNGPHPTSIGKEGCALTSMAMALSKLTGQTLTPDKLDAHLDTHRGYAKDAQGQGTNGLLWQVAGNAAQPPVTVTRKKQWDLGAIDAALEAGRPVVLGVDYRKDARTDHWVCLTRKDPGEPGLYHANDPATGREIHFRQDAEGRLVQVPGDGEKAPRRPYKSSGEFVTFKPRAHTAMPG